MERILMKENARCAWVLQDVFSGPDFPWGRSPTRGFEPDDKILMELFAAFARHIICFQIGLPE
jgi:hypothetical protein